MPELPEVETTCRGIKPHVIHQSLTSVNVRFPTLRWPIPKESLAHLKGRRVTEVTRKGKYILLFVGTGYVIIHLGMSGNLRIVRGALTPVKHDHVIFSFDNDVHMVLNDPRRFGCCLYHSDKDSMHPLLSDLGCEPLSDAFDANRLYLACQGRSKAIKQLIMDSHVVVGVGNIYACEALHKAKISPTAAASSLSVEQASSLVKAIKSVLGAAIDQGGTTLRDFVNSDGKPGYFKQQLQVYGREGNPCRNCGSKIQRDILAKRSTFYCPLCQAVL